MCNFASFYINESGNYKVADLVHHEKVVIPNSERGIVWFEAEWTGELPSALTVRDFDRPARRERATRRFLQRYKTRDEFLADVTCVTTDADGTVRHYDHGMIHREDGPAVEYADGSKDWYWAGQIMTEPA